jgi:polyisoprenoid-binding protein YceI
MEAEMTTGTRLTTEHAARHGEASEWAIDPTHSMVQFAVRHMMFTTVRGRFTDVRGTIHCRDEGHLESASVEVVIDAASIHTGDPQRDAHLRGEDFLDVEHYPTITFVSTRVVPTTEDQFRVVGNLTIRDVTREEVLETTFNGRGINPWGNVVAGFTAVTQIDRQQYGLSWNAALESGGFLVGNTIDVLIEIQAVKQE